MFIINVCFDEYILDTTYIDDKLKTMIYLLYVKITCK